MQEEDDDIGLQMFRCIQCLMIDQISNKQLLQDVIDYQSIDLV